MFYSGFIFAALIGASFASVDCSYEATTSEPVDYYTCTELTKTYDITIEDFFLLNPTLNTDCSNIEANTTYCIEGLIDGYAFGLTSCQSGDCSTLSTRANTTVTSLLVGGTSVDGTCGGLNAYRCSGSTFGSCCSSSGYCGSTSAYCGSGCQSLFGNCSTTKISTDGTCGGINGYLCQGSAFGNCCSSSGYCGSTSSYCSSGCQSSYGTCSSTQISTDGTCGGTNQYTCQGSSFGNCCSSSGYCGSTTSYCGTGCQLTYGTCSSAVTTTTSSQASVPSNISTDGACGPSNGKKCQGSGFGNCCSSSGYCGSTPSYCGTGCQLTYGTCSSVTTTTTTTSQASLPSNISIDGACSSNGKKCQGSGFGNCCSGTGYCGSTVNYCAQGCQSGFSSACLTSNVSTLDGTCGPTKGGYTCAGGPFNGNCCSVSGYCGLTSAFCGAGCQSGYGACT